MTGQPVLLGVEYRSCPRQIRETLCFTAGDASLFLKEAALSGYEAVLLSTCNRTELYLYRESPVARGEALGLLCGFRSADPASIGNYTFWLTGDDAVRHLFHVAPGLTSQLFGEDQILGQVRRALALSQEAGSCGPVLSRLFQDAVAAAKRVKTETSLSSVSVSHGTVAARLVRDRFPGRNPEILLIGTGEMGRITAKNLLSMGLTRLTATNRTRDRAQALSAELPGIRTIPYPDRASALQTADAVISCTASPHYTLLAADVSRREAGKPLLLIDLAVPRDIDPALGALPGAELYDIDRIGQILEGNRILREQAGLEAEQILSGEIERHLRRSALRETEPVIRQLEAYKTDLIERELSRCCASERSDALRRALSHAVDELTNTLVYEVRSQAETRRALDYFELIGAALSNKAVKGANG